MTTEENQSINASEPGADLAGVGYFLLFLPILALYPFYYGYASLNEDRDLESALKNSPLFKVPGFDAPDRLGVPLVGLVVFLGLFVGLAYATSITLYTTLTSLLGVVFGVVVLLWTVENGDMERDFTRRTTATVLIGGVPATVFALPSLLPFSPGAAWWWTTYFEISLITMTAVFIGATAANGYVITAHAFEQRMRKAEEHDEDDTTDHTETNSWVGEEISDSNGVELLERFTEDTWVAPDDLADSGTVEKTRRIEPIRDIVRGLWVEATRYSHRVPRTRFRDEKATHRTDYDSRHRVAPDGFASATYTFYVPGSRSIDPCGDCGGSGSLNCGRCGTTGTVTCGSCSGSGANTCGNCRGNGRVVVDERCGVCRGSGEKANGFTCNNCGGYGSIETEKICPECRSGEVTCARCNGSGRLTCDDCGGSGRHDCGTCAACGEIAEFEYVERSYTPDSDVSYRNKSVPTELLTDAEGTRVDIETDENPSQTDLYRRQEESRKIPVVTVTYEYLADTWELFSVEGTVKTRDFPRDYRKQFQLVKACIGLAVPVYLYLVLVGI